MSSPIYTAPSPAHIPSPPSHPFTFSPLHLVTLSLLLLAASTLSATEKLNQARPFLQKHCYSCHGQKKQENSKRFDNMGTELAQVETLELWQGILDQLNLGDMPPEDSPQPSAEEKQTVIDLLTAELKQAYAQQRSTGAQTVVRRLNRFELRNTVRDLLHIKDPELRIGNVARLVDNNGNGRVENTSTDPFRAFPEDEEEHGFDNIGDRLVMSDFFLKLLFDAVEESLAMATVTGPRPSVETRRFAGLVQKQAKGDLERFARELHPDVDTYFRRSMITADSLGGGVGTSARYRITVEVSAVNQKHPWGELLPTNQDEPLLLNLRLFKSRSRNDHIPLLQLNVPGDGKKRTFKTEAWIDKKWFPQLIWEDGPSDKEARTDLLMQKYLADKFRKAPDRKEIPDKKEYDEARKKWSADMGMTLVKNYRGPILKVHSFTLEPLVDQWPPESHTALYGLAPLTEEGVTPLLQAFAERAYRRPVTAEELQPFVQLVRSRLPSQAETPDVGIRQLTYKAYKGSWSKLPDFAALTPVAQGDLPSGLMDLKVAKINEHYGLLFEGKLTAKQAGEYKIQMASDDGGRVLIDGKTVVEHDGLHGASRREGKVNLAIGDHVITVQYFAYGQPNSLKVSWSGPGFGETPLTVGKESPKQLTDVSAEQAQMIKAMQVGYTAILCSPDFVYLQESAGRLNDYELASRLSYFLWSSMPDDALMQLARTGQLTNSNVLQQQVDRMLKDPKSIAFKQHFTERWLRLDKINESPPELNGPFRVYWDRKMQPQIIAQTVRYFSDLVDANGPIRNLIDSDYTYLNESIASVFYGRNDIRGEYLRKVATDDRRRGGVLTQPSVMTSTANGVDTSPVVRGVWVLENILGTPPSPPPPDVEPLPPDLRNAKTIREQIEAHREQESCNNCHRKIDPLGFPFENFDPIGRWRDRYRGINKPIDASTVTSKGREISDIVGLKEMLLDQEQQVIRCLTEKMLAYSSGRVLEPTDRGEVDKIVAKLDERGNRLRDLVKLIVQSDVFLTK